jgi:hypothetical protein
MGMQALIFSFKEDYEEFDDVSAAFTNVCLKADSPVSSPVVARCSLSHDLDTSGVQDGEEFRWSP